MVFECITGKRPFMLGEISVKWPSLIRQKEDDDIWGECKGNSDTATFMKTLPPSSLMCQALRERLTEW